MNETRVLVTGGAGFIGHHLTNALKRRGYWVRAIDVKPPEFGALEADEFVLLDMRRLDDAAAATCGVDHVYALAADMGGMGFISQHHARILHNNTLINLNTVEAARVNGVNRLLYTSSACVYPEYRQDEADVTPLAEEHAYPAQPQDAYGWEKLISERLCIYYRAGLRARDAHRALPQHLRAGRDVGRRTREGAGGAVPQDRDREADRPARDRDLGRRRADALVLLHRRLRRGHPSADAVGSSRAAQPRPGSARQHQRARRTSSRRLPSGR